jgi:hypothetical protein
VSDTGTGQKLVRLVRVSLQQDGTGPSLA